MRPGTAYECRSFGILTTRLAMFQALSPRSEEESGRRGDCSPQLPHHRTCGSAYGGSWQSLRTRQHSFSATMVAARKLSQSASTLRDKTIDGRVLPAKFSPSRVGESSGVYPGSLLSVLRPLLTPVPARQPFLATAPTVADGLGLQVSLSKNVNFCCTAGPFISGAERRAALYGASSPAPSTLYGLSVRRLISFDLRLPSHETSRSRSCLGLVLRPN